MTELVLMHHNEPMTTSLALAEGVKMAHHSVLVLLKRHIDSLMEFGRVEFEIQPFGTGGGKQYRDVYFLNEPQATLLITFMRNTPIVIAFKVALVKAFYELRANLAPPPQPQAVDHRADIMVSADRTFRAMLRSARSAGYALAYALRRANEITLRETGIDLLADLGPLPGPPGVTAPAPDPMAEAVAAWAAGVPGEISVPISKIMADAFGITPENPKYRRMVIKLGPVLRAQGFKKRKVHIGSGQAWMWER